MIIKSTIWNEFVVKVSAACNAVSDDTLLIPVLQL